MTHVFYRLSNGTYVFNEMAAKASKFPYEVRYYLDRKNRLHVPHEELIEADKNGLTTKFIDDGN